MNTDEEVLYVPWLTFYQSSVKTPTFRLWDVDGVRVDSKIKLEFSQKMWYHYSIIVADIHSVTAW